MGTARKTIFQGEEDGEQKQKIPFGTTGLVLNSGEPDQKAGFRFEFHEWQYAKVFLFQLLLTQIYFFWFCLFIFLFRFKDLKGVQFSHSAFWVWLNSVLHQLKLQLILLNNMWVFFVSRGLYLLCSSGRGKCWKDKGSLAMPSWMYMVGCPLSSQKFIDNAKHYLK